MTPYEKYQASVKSTAAADRQAIVDHLNSLPADERAMVLEFNKQLRAGYARLADRQSDGHRVQVMGRDVALELTYQLCRFVMKSRGEIG